MPLTRCGVELVVLDGGRSVNVNTAKLKVGVLAGLLGILMPIAARALDGEAFSPAVDPQGYFSTYSSKTSPRNRFYLGFWYDYAKNPLTIRTTPGSVEALPGLLGGIHAATDPITVPAANGTRPVDPITDPLLCALRPITDPLVKPVLDPFYQCPTVLPSRITLIKQLHSGNFVGSYSILDWLEIGLDVPVSYTDSDVAGVKDGFDIDNIKLNGKVQLMDPGTGGLGLAVVPFVEFPTGDNTHFTSNGKFNWGGLGVAELVSRRLRGSVNFGYKVNDDIGNSKEVNEILFAGGLGFLLLGEQPILGADQHRLELLGEVFGSTSANHAFKDEYQTPTEFLAGGRYYHPSGIQAGLGGGRRITDGINGPDYRIVATVGYSWQPKPPPPPAPPPPPTPPQEKVVVTEEQIITLEPIYFDFDKSTIKPVSYPILDQVVKVMNERPTMRVRVEGHTDSKGTEAYNQKLSQRRSEAVVKYLIGKGIDPSRLEAIGYGKSRPVAPNSNTDGSDNPTGRAKNRRTEFHVIQK